MPRVEKKGGSAAALADLLNAESLELRERLAELDRQIADLQNERRRLQERHRHITALLPEEKEGSLRMLPKLGRPSGSSPTSALLELAAAVLHERSPAPMHYRDLWEEVERRGGVIEGQDAAMGLISRLSRDERFCRPTSKGFYALRADYPLARNVGARRR